MHKPTDHFTDQERQYIIEETRRMVEQDADLPSDWQMPLDAQYAATILQVETRRLAHLTAQLYEQTGREEYKQANERINATLLPHARITPNRE